MRNMNLYSTESQITKIAFVALVSIGFKILMIFLSRYASLTGILIQMTSIVIDVAIASTTFCYLRRMITKKRAIFDFFESLLVIVTVMGNFYASIIGYAIYFDVFTSDEGFGRIILTVLSFANGNAVYTDKFECHEWYFSFVSIASMLMFALVMSVLLSMLSRSRDD